MRLTFEKSPTLSKGEAERMTRGNNASDGKNKHRVMRQEHAWQGEEVKLDGIFYRLMRHIYRGMGDRAQQPRRMGKAT